MGVKVQPFAYQTGVSLFAWKYEYSKDKNERNSIEDSSVSQLPQKAAHKSCDLQAVLYGGSSLKPPGASSGDCAQLRRASRHWYGLTLRPGSSEAQKTPSSPAVVLPPPGRHQPIALFIDGHHSDRDQMLFQRERHQSKFDDEEPAQVLPSGRGDDSAGT